MKLASMLLASALTVPSQEQPFRPPVSKEGCPPSTVRTPTESTGMDYVELSRSPCFGTCPVYTVRVYRNGLVTWNGGEGVSVTGTVNDHIAAPAAHALVERFRTLEFWRLCESYNAPVSDAPSQKLEVKFGGAAKKVLDYAESAPDFVRELQLAIDKVAETHRWIGR